MWNFIKRLFKIKKEASNPASTTEALPEIPSMEEVERFPGKRIAILIGHGAGDSGALCWNGMTEHEYNSQIAKMVSEKISAKLFYKAKSGWGSTYLQIATYRPDTCIELHLNAFNGKAVGCEVLCINEQSAHLGRSFANEFTARFNRKLRGDGGIKWLKSGDRGYSNVRSTSLMAKKAILVEPFFCDNKSEWVEPKEYADFLIEWLKGV